MCHTLTLFRVCVTPSLPPVCADSEVRLHKKCRELNAEIVANAAKVQTALKLNEEDQGTIAALKKEIEKAWKMVDARSVCCGRVCIWFLFP